LIWSYLVDADLGKIILLDWAPRMEECTLLLHDRSMDRLPDSIGRIPPTGDKPGFPIPKNKMEFSIVTPIETIQTIRSQYANLRPWKITVVVLVIDKNSTDEYTNDLITVLTSIESTLAQATHFIVLVNEVSCIFRVGMNGAQQINIAEVCRENCDSMIGHFNRIVEGKNVPKGDFCQMLLDAYPVVPEGPTSPLLSVVMPLHSRDTWEYYALNLSVSGPPDMRWHLMVSRTEGMDIFTNEVKKNCFQWVSFFENTYHNGYPVTRGVLDFSMGNRLVKLSISLSQEIVRVVFPKNSTRMEVLELNLDNYNGPSLFATGPDFSRLQQLTLPRHRQPVSYLSSHLLALRQFQADSLPHNSVLDFSNVTMPGLDLNFLHLFQQIKLVPPPPEVALGRFSVQWVALFQESVLATLLRVRRLHLSYTDSNALSGLSARINGTPEALDMPFSSTILEELTLTSSTEKYYEEKMAGYIPSRLGVFPCLRHLTLDGLITRFRGECAPCLETLTIEGGGHKSSEIMTPVGQFPLLCSFTLRNGELSGDIDFKAPCLQELMFDRVMHLNQVTVGRSRFPALQAMSIMMQRGCLELVGDWGCPKFCKEASSVGRPSLALNVDYDTSPETMMELGRLAGPEWSVFCVCYPAIWKKFQE